MSRFTHRLHVPIVVLLALVLILSACGTPPIEQPQAGASTAPSGSTAPAASVASSERSKTVIFDIDGGRVADPTAWNPFVPQSRVDQGFHQAMIEPLFILNYESGEIEPWLGESMSSNQELDLWTLKLRDGIKWSDGQPFTSDDVVFTIQMLLSNTEKTLNNAAAMQQWVKSVNAVDPRTVEFTLNNANPRFQLDYFSVKIFGSIPIVPKHVWEGQGLARIHRSLQA